MAYVISAYSTPTLPVAGTDDVFPLNRIFCVGRNYREHAREMGHDPDRELPFFFMKPGVAVLPPGHDFPYPAHSTDVHHEIELVVALARGGANIPAQDALQTVYGYAVGLDMTRHDLQLEAKKSGRPWEVGKSFENSAPCSTIQPTHKIGHPSAGAIWLDINGKRTQSGDISTLIWKVPEIISILSGLFTLSAGDLIFTGTPAGVGPVKRNDLLHGEVEKVGELTVRVI